MQVSLIIVIDIGSLNLISHNMDAGAIQEIIDDIMFELKEFRVSQSSFNGFIYMCSPHNKLLPKIQENN